MMPIDAQRHAHARDVAGRWVASSAPTVVPMGSAQRGDVLDAARHGLDALFVERQAVEHRARQSLGARRVHVARIGG